MVFFCVGGGNYRRLPACNCLAEVWGGGMKPEIVFASSNRGKLQEVRGVMSRFDRIIIDPLELNERCGTPPDVDESASTYRENAELKARAYWEWSGQTVIADDTGLEVDALHGAPGVRSARYAGAAATAQQNCEKLLRELEGSTDRSARFVCYLILIDESQKIHHAYGTLSGEIARSPSGSGGFGYDNIFFLPEYKMTLAEAKERGVPVITHRIAALQNLFS